MKHLVFAVSFACSVTAAFAYDGTRAFGLHFDFHARPTSVSGAKTPIYDKLTEDDVRTICRTIRPDFIQVDCKGHPGFASYPSALGNSAPTLKQDGLAIWRKVTKEEGVGLFVHYSGVADQKYFTEHPDEAVKGADGWPVKGERATRPNGRYVDDLLLPQLKELAGKYGIDGAWVDGECWAARADFDPRTVAQFERETGIALDGALPDADGKPYRREYLDFSRGLFAKYMSHYIDEMHKAYPNFKITSNWAFTDVMPVEVCANVDFISGDLAPGNSTYAAMLSARAAAQQGKPWDLMAWEFRNPGAAVPKSTAQLCQEAAAVTALGGGFQVYVVQRPDGQPRMARVKALKDVADFVRARQPFAFGGRQEKQVGVLLSTEDFLASSPNVFVSSTSRLYTMELVGLLCDSGHAVSVLMDHHLKSADFDSWPVIAIPEVNVGLSPAVVERLLAYVRNGGTLLIDGPKACEAFVRAGAPFALAGKPSETPSYFKLDGVHEGSLRKTAGLKDGGDVVARLTSLRTEETLGPVVAVFPYGKGKIAAIAANLSDTYMFEAQFTHRQLARAILDRLYTPIVEVVAAKGLAQVVPLVVNGKRMIQIVNANGRHRDDASLTEDFIPPLADVELKLHLGAKPSALVLQPAGKPLDFIWRDGVARVTLPRVDFHDIIEVK